jgi:hypothetical protein
MVRVVVRWYSAYYGYRWACSAYCASRFVSDFNADVGVSDQVPVPQANCAWRTGTYDDRTIGLQQQHRPIGECAVLRQHDCVVGARIRCRAQPFAIQVVNIWVRHPPDDPIEDPQARAGRGHYAAFAATGAILPTTSVVCSSA